MVFRFVVIKNKTYLKFSSVDGALHYLKTWTSQFRSFKMFGWIRLNDTLKWQDVEAVMRSLEENNLYNADEKAVHLHAQFRYVKEYCTSDKIKQWREEKITVVSRWVEVFTHLDKVECQFQEMSTIVEYILALPGTTASVERIFSAVNKTWTSDKTKLSVDTLAAIMAVKCNLKYTCINFYSYLLTQTNLLRQIGAKEKYSPTTESEEEYEVL